MKTITWTAVALIAGSLWACEADNLYFDNFLNDMTVNFDDEDDAVCGDGRLDPGEECDDGNTWNWDGCSADCYWEEMGCYDQYMIYHMPGEIWSYWENEECVCWGDGMWECWTTDYEDVGCNVDGKFFPVGDQIPMPDGTQCTCIDWDLLDCDGKLIPVV